MKQSGTEVFLKLFQPARPAFERTQEECLSWLASAHAKAEGRFAEKGFERKIRKALERFGCGPERISKRGVELEDFLHTHWEEMRLFNLVERSGGAGTDARTRFFEEKVDLAFRRLYPERIDPPNALIHVTCTGYVSPSGAQKLVVERGWNERTRVFHAYHMGCSAAMPAIGIGAGLLAYDRNVRRIDIVHTELCSLHFDPIAHTPEQFVIQSLFGDGSIRYSLLPAAGTNSEKGLRLLALREVVIPETLESMAWRVGDRGMRMVLSRDIPTAIGASIEDFFSKLFAEAELDFQVERGRTVFAIHPGGPRILDQMERLLGLERWQISASQEVLYQHGNMSSATLPHVWARIVEDDSLPKGTQVASVAFGPGVTISGALFAKA